MPKLVTPDTFPALKITKDANFYRIQGIEFTTGRRDYSVIVSVGNGDETSVTQLPHDLDFDRDYVHGDPQVGSHRGIALNGGATTVENCYISAIFNTKRQDTQAVGGWNGPGPYTIVNNYLEASGENVFFGGAPTSISAGVVPSDILIARNDIYKPTSWMAHKTDYWVKNLLEVKNGQRITIDHNTFTNNWVGADQLGFAIVLSVRDESGRVPWATVNNITMTNNHIAHVGGGIFFLGHDADGGGTAHDMTIRNNLWEDVGAFSTQGRLFEFVNDLKNITIDHNTAYQYGSGPWIEDYGTAPSSNIEVTNNIVNAGIGIGGEGTASGLPTLDHYDYYQYGGAFMGNLVIGGPWPNPSIPDYPTSTTYKNGWVATASAASTSTYTGTDGQHPGCNGDVPATLYHSKCELR
jgi:Right handed beta helix region